MIQIPLLNKQALTLLPTIPAALSVGSSVTADYDTVKWYLHSKMLTRLKNIAGKFLNTGTMTTPFFITLINNYIKYFLLTKYLY